MDMVEGTLGEEWLVMLDNRFWFFIFLLFVGGWEREMERKEMGLSVSPVACAVCVMSHDL